MGWYDPHPGAFGEDDPGGGPPVDGTPEGLRWWYEEPAIKLPDLSWGAILTHWDAIETDFQHFYNVDLADGTLGRRTWRWFRIRVVRLLAEDTYLAHLLGLRDIKKPTPER